MLKIRAIGGTEQGGPASADARHPWWAHFLAEVAEGGAGPDPSSAITTRSSLPSRARARGPEPVRGLCRLRSGVGS